MVTFNAALRQAARRGAPACPIIRPNAAAGAGALAAQRLLLCDGYGLQYNAGLFVLARIAGSNCQRLVQPAGHLAKNSVLVCKVWCGSVSDEELAAV